MRPVVVLVAWLATGAALAAEPAERTLCQPGEALVFSCTVGAKLASLCRSGNDRLSYRFGKPGAVELAYPNAGAIGAFERSNALLYGGGIVTVSFKLGEFEYGIYSKMGRAAGGGDPETEDGIAVARNGKRVATLVCDDGGAGFRESIESLPKKPG